VERKVGALCPALVDDEPVGAAVRKTVLDNGISIVTEHVPNGHSVSMGILFDCGPQSESPTQSGLAHFCEHMLFQGTSNRNATEINRFIDEVGGRVGAFTTRDFTCFVASVLGDYSYHALDLLGDLLLNSTFPEEHIERERQAIVCEIQSENDVPQRRAMGTKNEGERTKGTVPFAVVPFAVPFASQ
jgi:predicted Zn-dependent peptidase